MTDSEDEILLPTLSSIVMKDVSCLYDPSSYFKVSCPHKYVTIHTNPNIHDYGDETYFMCIVCGDKRDIN
jgi:hypothetical protein